MFWWEKCNRRSWKDLLLFYPPCILHVNINKTDRKLWRCHSVWKLKQERGFRFFLISIETFSCTCFSYNIFSWCPTGFACQLQLWSLGASFMLGWIISAHITRSAALKSLKYNSMWATVLEYAVISLGHSLLVRMKSTRVTWPCPNPGAKVYVYTDENIVKHSLRHSYKW